MTFASTFGASLRWMEARSGLPYEQRFGDADVVRLNLAQAEKQLEEGTVRRQACRLMVVMVVAMELMVLDTTVGIAFRVLAWMRLIKLYATMRADDLQRLRPEDVHLGPSGLKGILRRSKTTGAAKRVKTLPVFVPKEASVSGVDWLNVGYTLWKEAADFERDFFMPRVVPDGSGFWWKCPTPGDLVAMGVKVIELLKTPQKVVGGEPNGAGWQLTEETLVGRILAPAWTGHSERATLPSALAAFGVEKDKRTYLGRWSPEGGDVYVRTHRVVIKNCVMIFAREAKSPDVLETLAEDDIVAGVVDVIQAKKGVDMELVKAQAVGLLGRARDAYLWSC